MTSNQAEIEARIREAVSLDEPWAFVEKLATLTRLSGNDDEREAIDFLTAKLDAFGVPYTLHTPTLFVSWPLGASLRTLGDDPLDVLAKTPAMSVSTGGEEREGELVYLPTGYAKDVTDIFSVGEIGDLDFTGKVVITEGLPMPAKVGELTARGAAAAVFVGPGERIHEGVCTTIWGSPDLETMGRQPAIPIIAVNRPQGAALIERAKAGGTRVAYSTKLETAWRPIPILVAEIAGAALPDEFVLLHAHLDSWHIGIGDNATGDATLLEVARVLHHFTNDLTRSVRIAWWSGHSHGRYAGSTWFADEFGIELAEKCVAQINCDSPGCRWAEVFTDLMWTEETAPLAARVVRDVTGVEPIWARPLRAGDYSFSNLGLSGFFMLSSTMTAEARAERGYYPVGGCGGNIAWHTEDDTLEIADREHLLRDMRLYATAVYRAASLPFLPFDFRLTLDGFERTLAGYQEQAGAAFDLQPALEEIATLRGSLDGFYARAAALEGRDATDPAVRAAADVQRKLARILIPVNYAREGRFRQDPAENVAPLPDLAVARRLRRAAAGSHEHHAARISLQRGLNRLIWALRRADDVVTRGDVVEA
ncbi:MAG: M28 family peptidase [Thermomicrobiales bacterium]|nr:M28 family peptidase [Thermomicrobiales bacterium]